ncbi:MAG: hypothetical protein R2710_13335 [Acidimicrobiales bacterium]
MRSKTSCVGWVRSRSTRSRKRCAGIDAGAAVAELLDQRRIIGVAVGGEQRLAAAEDASRLRDALGVALPPGLPQAFTDSVADPLGDLLTRYARTHTPFLTDEVADRYGLEPERARRGLDELERLGRIVRGEFRPDGVEREWCHNDVLRVLRRRSLAALRREVEPVDHDVLARFLPDWQHVGSRLHGVDGLAEVITSLQGAALPASMLEVDILPARLPAYRSTDLDTLLTAGEVVWVGGGALGSDDGRLRLLWRDQVPFLSPEPADERPDDPIHAALRARLASGGASFWSDLVDAAQAAELDYTDTSVLRALWDLVWAGEVTNDSLTPLRALIGGAGPSKAGASSRGRTGRRPNLRSLSRLGPPAATGRWSLVDQLRRPAATPTEQATARALQLLERYGVLTREMALAEGAAGGFAGVYPVLKELEDRGQVRRGYFVAGLGAAQFALPGAVDRLRSERDANIHDAAFDADADLLVLAATDPAQPYGAALPWPDTEGRPSRSIGAYVVLRRGIPLVFLDRGARSLVTFAQPDGHDLANDGAWVQALAGLVARKQLKRIEITKVDGSPSAEHPAIRDLLLANGFKQGYKGPTLR